MVLRFYHYPIPALPPNAPMTPAALAPTPAPPETCVRADRKACRKGAVGGPVLGPLARTRAIFTDRHLLRGIPRVCIGIMRVRRATHGGGIMKPVVIYRAPDEKRAIFFERFAATPFYGSDVSGEEARKHIIRARPLSAPLICSPPRKTSRSRKTWRSCRASPIKPVSKHGQPTNYLTSPFKSSLWCAWCSSMIMRDESRMWCSEI